jgi:hypothetical protein
MAHVHLLPVTAPSSLDQLRRSGISFYWTACRTTAKVRELAVGPSLATCPVCLDVHARASAQEPLPEPSLDDFDLVQSEISSMMGSSELEQVRPTASYEVRSVATRPPTPAPPDPVLLERLLLDPEVDAQDGLFGCPDVRMALTPAERQEMGVLLGQIRSFGLAQMAAPIVRTLFRLCDKVVGADHEEVVQDAVVEDETPVLPDHEVDTNTDPCSAVEE